ncbi:glycosyltransferase family 4 protein [Wenyingzhuangia aestuarii]|uniref:glycosyltransferase family 4 protein n=1 Tax=Wenyingzhuangia aestuarii TaxID=1647582 RepID=UPI00143C8673|nr:glycosyltransferase [Wenyingzhuangia aestuarii]NJB82464.1 glycosyltransferase involved in cell wall biosynthesis [Wenyingzhuangia aestuarii]
MKNILITAYAVNPYKGSEDGTGWNISRELAKQNQVHVITRKNNQAEIDRYLAEQNDEVANSMHFYYYDLPKGIMNLKHKLGERGYVLYYYFWQLFIPFFVTKNNIKFDISHALNFHSDSHPQFLWMLNKPVFWGPIGHHPPVPKQYLKPIYGTKNWLKDRLYNTVKIAMRNLDPFFYISKWTAKGIFVINSGVNKSVRANPKKIHIVPAVANNKIVVPSTTVNSKFTVLAVGRFVYMKGFDITIKAFANFYKCLSSRDQQKVKLKLVGKGEELTKMMSIIKKEEIEHAVEIIKWVEKKEMENIYKSSSVFCFGSHEGAGMVIPEALSYGVPVVCFDNYGPGELCDDTCAIKVPYGDYHQSVVDFSKALQTLFLNSNMHQTYAKNALDFAKNKFTWSYKASRINQAYQNI